MKPTENTFFFLFKRVRAPHPIEKVELLESLEKPKYPQRGLFDLFDLFDRWVSVGNNREGGCQKSADLHAGTDCLVNL
jgi:hypothetical protein